MLFSCFREYSPYCKGPAKIERRLNPALIAPEFNHETTGGQNLLYAFFEMKLMHPWAENRDHYQYFSQLIIAFKTMAVDMVALLVLILISCSGFFVAFTSFARNSSSATEIS